MVEPTSIRRLTLAVPLDLRLTLGPLLHGRFDPCGRMDGDRIWRATRTPEGPVTVRLHVDRSTATLQADTWGPGGAWFLDSLPQQVGLHDDHEPLEVLLQRVPRTPADELLRQVHRQLPGMRLARTGVVAEHLVPVVLEQRVTTREARKSWSALVRRFGAPAPGPASDALRLRLPPDLGRLAETPYWVFHRMGVERSRAETVRRVAADAARLDATADGPLDAAHAAMTRLRGVGPWSAAEVALAAMGDPDAVSVGDFHLKNYVACALAGEPRGTDDRMLELLEPYRGQRGRVTKLIVRSGLAPPKFGPKQRVHDFRAS